VNNCRLSKQTIEVNKKDLADIDINNTDPRKEEKKVPIRQKYHQSYAKISAMPPLEKGQQFPSFKACKDAVGEWSIEEKFTARVNESDSTRVVYRCAISECSFSIRAFFNKKEKCVEVGLTNPVHLCYGAGDVSRKESSRQKWLLRILPSTLTIDNKTIPRTMVQAVLHRHQERITTAVASKAKRQILGHSLQHQASQYEMLPAYASLLIQTNPGTYVKLAVDTNTQRFQRIFICPPTSSKSFAHCRPFIAVDGTFTKTEFIQTLLLAVGIDADNHAVLLAWGLVESETEDSWRFFLTNLRSAMPIVNSSHVTLMSDWDKGLAAASTELPETKRAHCIQDLAENVGKTFRKEARISFQLSPAHQPKKTMRPISKDFMNIVYLQLSMLSHWIGQNIAHLSSPAEPMDILLQILLNQLTIAFSMNEHSPALSS